MGLLGLFLSALAWALGIAIVILGWFGVPDWAKVTIVIVIIVWVIAYLIMMRRHNRRNVSGEALQEDLWLAGRKTLSNRERLENRFRGADHKLRTEVEKLYPRDHH